MLHQLRSNCINVASTLGFSAHLIAGISGHTLQSKLYDAYLEAPLHQKIELATKMTSLAVADLTPSALQIEAYKSAEENINNKFNEIVQQNAFRDLAEVSSKYDSKGLSLNVYAFALDHTV